jgi:hypothetical protein
LHRPSNDAIAMAIGDQTVTVGIPGKPDAHTKNADGQVRMQLSDTVHSTRNDGQAAYHTVGIELLRPQTGERNLRATVLASQPLNCPAVAADASASKHVDLTQFESDQTRVRTVRVLPHQDIKTGDPAQAELIVALDPASITLASGKGPDELLRAEEFLWFE